MIEPLIDINDLSVELKISAKTIRNRLSKKSWPIPPIRIGRTLRWRRADVIRTLTKLAELNENGRQLDALEKSAASNRGSGLESFKRG
jgi:predicted DNA-binding transcriptional regulator AlpA